MVIDLEPGAARREPRIPRTDLARASYDARGVFTAGRHAELEALRAMGAREPSLGRLYEGHFNGVLLACLYGTPAQRERACADAHAGRLFGVWNTQDDDPVRVERTADGFRLSGAKTWASGADSVTRALVTARTSGDGALMCLVPLDRVAVDVDPSAWRPLGMEGSNSYRVCFDGVDLAVDDIIGAPGDYERPPWFLAGALRFVAVHVGIMERLTAETLSYLAAKGRASDPYQCARAGEMRVLTRGAWHWVQAGAAAWIAYDAQPNEETAAAVLDTVDMARVATERAALDVLERATRCVGAHGLVEPLPFARLIRDLQMYLRQPAPDAVLARVGATGLRTASAERSLAIADSTGSSL
jgi:alkylation response protein AidB-like acyl-CoA dehydrogenase